jgi:transposase
VERLTVWTPSFRNSPSKRVSPHWFSRPNRTIRFSHFKCARGRSVRVPQPLWDQFKLLYWDEDGLAVWAKRLEQGTFEFPMPEADEHAVEVKATELALILGGIELRPGACRK